ncbi:MAG TPA: hypothetical protein PKA37_12820 [Planctomycetota bacterium]|jgi:hypothetical protein|nr:hypothetical protein [Planctomycetota bacterium]
MSRILFSVLSLCLVLPFVSCGDDAGKAMADKFQTTLDSINLDAIKSKAAGADEAVRTEVGGLISQLESKKTEVLEMVKKLAETKGVDVASLGAKITESMKSVTALFAEIKTKLGM